ncbi:hypothetical protein KFE25_009598 [Diacronema lutheri]|uniref:Uncharacterized protein n=2 Tax=Diacronema lutheri TaxID=2081491 RepID=A0A8J5XYJ1_DIALT|nr:hypothetical protein KFE25_009598 [Diacronema lutheri]
MRDWFERRLSQGGVPGSTGLGPPAPAVLAAAPAAHAHDDAALRRAGACGARAMAIDYNGRNPSIHSSRNSSPVGKVERAAQPAQPAGGDSPRKKRKSLDDASAAVEPTGLIHQNHNARELLLARLASQTGLPRGCLQLESVPDPTAPHARPRLRVHIKCNAMLQPSSEWVYNQSWLRRQDELAGETEVEAAHPATSERAPSDRRACLRAAAVTARAANSSRGVTFDAAPPAILDMLPADVPHSELPAAAVAAAVAAAAAGESDPAAGFDQLMRL